MNLGFIYTFKPGNGAAFPPRYKARLVFKNHKFATDSTWEESFSPVVDKSTLRLFFTMVGKRNMHMRQADVRTAYLNAEMPDVIYICLSNICGDETDWVRQLYRALYGHPKAGQLWNKLFVEFASSEGYLQSVRDSCLFYHPIHDCLLVLYVDDLLGACENLSIVKEFWKKLSAKFNIRDLGGPTHFLGIDICHLPSQSAVTLSQQKYILELAKKYDLPTTLRPLTPISSDYYKKLEAAQHQPIVEDFPYKELVGALIFVMTCTRPDIAFAVCCLTQYFSAPRAIHWEQALRCLGYLAATSSYGLILGKGGGEDLVAFSDSDWAGDPITRRSIGGFLIFFGNSLLCWSSKTQRGLIALSSTESEFIQLALSIRQLLYIQPIFVELKYPEIEKFTILYGDNLPSISSIGNKSAKSRTKHVDIRLKFCGEVVNAGKITIQHVSTEHNLADIFTKPLPAPRFRLLRDTIVFDLTFMTNKDSKAMDTALVALNSFSSCIRF